MTKMIKSKKGFTLIELIVVIAIIAILAAILVPSLLAYMEKANLRKADSNVKNVYNSAASAYTDIMSDSSASFADLKDKTMDLLGDSFNDADVTVNATEADGVQSASWGDGKYWATYNANGTITHGKGAVGSSPIS